MAKFIIYPRIIPNLNIYIFTKNTICKYLFCTGKL